MRQDQQGLAGTPEYHSWSSMRHRCLNPKADSYSRYGGRGITICERWVSSFINFFQDMGKRPSLLYTLDRVDSNGNYEPGNCRWATAKEQSNNRLKRVGRVNLTCQTCGKAYSKIRARAEGSKYCSSKCLFLGRTTRVFVTCMSCGKSLERIPSAIRGGQTFCSRSCANKFRRSGETEFMQVS